MERQNGTLASTIGKKTARMLLGWTLVFTLVFCPFATAFGATEQSNGQEGTGQNATSAYQATDSDKLDEYMTNLTETIGCRLMGTPNEHKAADYILKKFEEFGYTGAEIVPVTLADTRKTPVSRVVFNEGQPNEKEFYGNYYGPDLAENVYDLVDATELSNLPTDPVYSSVYSGKVIVTKLSTVRLLPDTVSGSTVMISTYAGIVKETGAAALVIYNDEMSSKNFPATLSLKDVVTEIPILAMDGVVGPRILTENPPTLGRYVKGDTSNVVAVKKANTNPDNPDAIIHITAHFDSVLGAPGASDNASGTAALLDLARVYQSVNTGGIELRFAAVGAEEGGLNGSKAYVETLTTTEKAISINFNMDMLGTNWPEANAVSLDISPSKKGVFNLPGALIITGAEELTWISGTENVRWYQYGSSDHVSFQNAGVDAASMIRATDMDDDIEPADHTTQDNMAYNHSKDRLHEAANMVSKGIGRAIDRTLTLKAELSAVGSGGLVSVNNASKLSGLFDSLEIQLTTKDEQTIEPITTVKENNFSFTLPVGEYTATIVGKGSGTANVKGTFGKDKIQTYSTKLGSYELSRSASSGGGSSGGGGGSSSSSTTTTPTENKTVEVNYTASGGVASANLSTAKVDEIIKSATKGEATIDLSKASGVTAAQLPKDALTSMEKAGLDVAVKLPTGTLTMNDKMVSSVLEQAAGNNIKMELKSVTTRTLNTEQKKAVKDGDVVFNINIIDGTNKITKFNGTLSVQILQKVPAPVGVWYLDDQGNLEKVNCTVKGDTVSFDLNHTSLYVIGKDTSWQNPFTDVKSGDWYYTATEFVVTKGLFNGTSDTTFGPKEPMTRAMLTTVLYRQAGSPATGTPDFTDVKNGQWYSNAIAWASEKGIVKGFAGGGFAPNQNITREQMAVILYNYTKAVNGDTTSTGEGYSACPDASSVSSWAQEAMNWAYNQKLIAGKENGNLDPKGEATRAEVATILMRYIK